MAADADVKYKLEDILNKQKAPPQILDLVHVKIDTEEEYKNVIEKIPDYKIKPERDEEIEAILAYEDEVSASREEFPEDKVQKSSKADKQGASSRFVSGGSQNPMQMTIDPAQKSSQPSSAPEIPYQFADPCPVSMREVNIADLSAVDINWKMLTLARPKTKVDEEIFSKLVQLDKLRLKTRTKEEEQALARGGKDPFIVVKTPSQSKGGVAETSIKVCTECEEEFCCGSCKDFQYDSYQRLIIEEKETEKNAVDTATLMGGPKGKKGKGKGALRGKGKKKRGGGPNNIARMPVM